MFNKKVVYEAIKGSLELDSGQKLTPESRPFGQDSLVSLLIHDIFGGEILKTRKRKNWHFYNRVEGERVDFTGSEAVKFDREAIFEDIPSTPDETYDYIDQTDYTAFLLKFVRTFEEKVGLDKYKASVSV